MLSLINNAPIIWWGPKQLFLQMQLPQNGKSFQSNKVHEWEPNIFGLRYGHWGPQLDQTFCTFDGYYYQSPTNYKMWAQNNLTCYSVSVAPAFDMEMPCYQTNYTKTKKGINDHAKYEKINLMNHYMHEGTLQLIFHVKGIFSWNIIIKRRVKT